MKLAFFMQVWGPIAMPKIPRHKTDYPGVYYIMGRAVATGKPEKIYYIRYRKGGKLFEEKAGRQFQDDMTTVRAANKRSRKIEGDQLSNQEVREAEEARKAKEAQRWTINRLWKEYKKNKPGLKGIVTDENRFNNHIKPGLANKEPKDILPLDIKRLEIKLSRTKAPATVANVLELLRRIINFGSRHQLISPLRLTIEMPLVNNEKTEDLSPEQLTKLLEAIEKDTHPQAGSMMKMALFTGMRRGEMFKLKWKHIDFERGFILIKGPKGGPDQKIPLNDASRELLDNIPKTDSAYVFPGRGGRQRTDINKAVNKIKTAAGLPKDFRPLHGLRHVYASMLASSGQVDMYTLQKLLTHKDPKMTQRYAHLRDETLKKASNLAGSIIEKASKDAEKKRKQKKRNKIEV
jgi:integrase